MINRYIKLKTLVAGAYSAILEGQIFCVQLSPFELNEEVITVSIPLLSRPSVNVECEIYQLDRCHYDILTYEEMQLYRLLNE